MEQLVRSMMLLLFGAVFVVSPFLEMSESFSTQVFAGPSDSNKEVLIDINSATPDQLKTLIGIGDIYAKRIVEGRPYQNTEELLKKKIIPEAAYDKIKDQVTTRPK